MNLSILRVERKRKRLGTSKCFFHILWSGFQAYPLLDPVKKYRCWISQQQNIDLKFKRSLWNAASVSWDKELENFDSQGQKWLCFWKILKLLYSVFSLPICHTGQKGNTEYITKAVGQGLLQKQWIFFGLVTNISLLFHPLPFYFFPLAFSLSHTFLFQGTFCTYFI